MIGYTSLEKFKYASRPQKAFKIEHILLDYFEATGENPKSLVCLDIGGSIGVIANRLTRLFAQVLEIEPLLEALTVARQLHPKSPFILLQGDGLSLPFKDESLDVIICAQVYEHTQSPERLVNEIQRVLKPGGCCFFSGPNRLWPIEYHYGWWFIHWLPRRITDLYCRHRYGHPYDLSLYTYWQLRALWKNFLWQDYSLRLIYESEKYLGHNLYWWVRYLFPPSLLRLFRFLLPNFNWMLTKVHSQDKR